MLIFCSSVSAVDRRICWTRTTVSGGKLVKDVKWVINLETSGVTFARWEEDPPLLAAEVVTEESEAEAEVEAEDPFPWLLLCF